LLGTATIPVLFFLGRQLCDREVGLMAAGLVAVSRWHIILSRTGLRFILMPLLSLLLIAALDWALKSRRPLHWAVVGLVLGWGFHTYNAWLIMPAVVLTGWMARQVIQNDWSRSDFSGLVFSLVIAALLTIPLIRFAHDDPEIFSLRVASRISGVEQPLPGDVIKVAWDNVVRTAVMFNVTGDGVAHINVPLKRQLGLFSAVLFVFGIAYSLIHWRRNSFLLLALILTCLPSTLSLAFPNEVPNAGRSSGAIGFSCLVAAVPLALWRRHLHSVLEGMRWRPVRDTARAALLMVVMLVLAAEGGESSVDYFERYRFAQPGGNYAISIRLVETIREYGQSGEVYLKAYSHWYDGNALRTQLRLAGIEWENELMEIRADSPPQSNKSGPIVVMLHPHDTGSLTALQIAFPHAAVFTRYDNHGVPALKVLVAE
jgi:hypothetical protein